MDLNISVMPEWCYHSRFLGPQYFCHVRLVVSVVILCYVPTKSLSLAWRTGPSGAPIIGSYRDPMHIDTPFHFNEDFRNWYNCTHIYFFLDNEEMFSR